MTINGFNSDLQEINCGLPLESIIGPLLFLTYTNELYYCIKFCKVHHFADDTCLINFNSSMKVDNKQANKEFEKKMVNWVNSNKICLNVTKTEFVLFKSARKSNLQGQLKT